MKIVFDDVNEMLSVMESVSPEDIEIQSNGSGLTLKSYPDAIDDLLDDGAIIMNFDILDNGNTLAKILYRGYTHTILFV